MFLRSSYLGRLSQNKFGIAHRVHKVGVPRIRRQQTGSLPEDNSHPKKPEVGLEQLGDARYQISRRGVGAGTDQLRYLSGHDQE